MLALITAAWALDAHGFVLAATTGDPATFTRIGSTEVGARGDWDTGVVVDYADDPLSELLPEGRAPVLDALATANLFGGCSFGVLRIDGVLPVHAGADTGGTFLAPGDARLGALVPLPGLPGVAAQTAVFLPTGADAHWVGGAPRLLAAAVASRELGAFGVIGRAGALVSLPDEARGLTASVGPVLGIGGAWHATDAVSAMLEVSTESAWGLASIPVEATVAGRVRLPMGAWATADGAAGLGDGVGASRWRGFVGIGFSRRAPVHMSAVVYLGPDPTSDRDGDGFFDVDDACPDQAETVDGFTDGDGCPELDGDGDGVTFEEDRCPGEPILAEQDPRYSDGCPRVAEFAGDRIVITEAIFFREGRAELLPSADRVLGAVRDEMTAHPEIGLLIVEGHTNSNGSDASNARLSDARAFAVMRWLVAAGEDPLRLVSKGYGEARPLLGDTEPDAFAVNRRVEFKVLRVEDVPAGARRIELPPEVR